MIFPLKKTLPDQSTYLLFQTDVKHCKKLAKIDDYYSDAYSIDNFKQQISNDDEFINFPFYARANNWLCVVLLSHSNAHSNGYEFRINMKESGNNAETQLRKNANGEILIKSSVKTPSREEIIGYTLRLSRNKTLSATFIGDSVPFISHQFDDTIDINHIVFG